MTTRTAIIAYICICTVTTIALNCAFSISLKRAILDRQQIEKRAYKRMTPENKELIEYIIFGENQE